MAVGQLHADCLHELAEMKVERDEARKAAQLSAEAVRVWQGKCDALAAQLDDERRNTDEAHDARRAVISERDAALEREQALAAHVERLREALFIARPHIAPYNIHDYGICDAALDATPETSVARRTAVQAEEES